jgi:hypothetical protein
MRKERNGQRWFIMMSYMCAQPILGLNFVERNKMKAGSMTEVH